MPNTANFASIKRFFEENSHKIYMKEIDGLGKHQLDIEAINKWKSKIQSMHNLTNNNSELATYIKFIDAVLETTRYITFTEYYAKIQQVAADMMPLIQNADVVFLVTSGAIKKSNTWVMLLFVGELLHLGLETYSNKVFLTHMDKATERNGIHLSTGADEMNAYCNANTDKKVVVFHFDDMSYSGSQIYEDIQSLLLPKPPIANLSYYIAVAFITNRAKDYLLWVFRESQSLGFLPSTEGIATFNESVKILYKDDPELLKRIDYICNDGLFTKTIKTNESILPFKRGRNTFICNTGMQSSVYFDHKIADETSIISTFLQMGPYPENVTLPQLKQIFSGRREVKKLYSGSLISGCNNTSPETCYPSFYSKITYTFNGTPLQSNERLINQLNKNSSGGAYTLRKYKKRKYTKKMVKKI